MEQLVRIMRLIAGILAVIAILCIANEFGRFTDRPDFFRGPTRAAVNFSTLITLFGMGSVSVFMSFVLRASAWASRVVIIGTVFIAIGTAIPIVINAEFAGTVIMVGVAATIAAGVAVAIPLIARK